MLVTLNLQRKYLITKECYRGFNYTVSISGLEPDSPQAQPWQSKIVAENKVHCLYSQQLFYSGRAGGLGCLDQYQISILYIADTVKLKLWVDYYGDWCRSLVWLGLRYTLDILQWPWPCLWCVCDLVRCTLVWVRSAWIQLPCPWFWVQSERIIQRVGV